MAIILVTREHKYIVKTANAAHQIEKKILSLIPICRYFIMYNAPIYYEFYNKLSVIRRVSKTRCSVIKSVFCHTIDEINIFSIHYNINYLCQISSSGKRQFQ